MLHYSTCSKTSRCVGLWGNLFDVRYLIHNPLQGKRKIIISDGRFLSIPFACFTVCLPLTSVRRYQFPKWKYSDIQYWFHDHKHEKYKQLWRKLWISRKRITTHVITSLSASQPCSVNMVKAKITLQRKLEYR